MIQNPAIIQDSAGTASITFNNTWTLEKKIILNLAFTFIPPGLFNNIWKQNSLA